LKIELTDFVASIRDRRAPTVDGAAGRAALALDTQIADSISTGVRP